ncbi:MAG TPA: winged helix-turn-helix domain-containing protein [Ktedonobacteraceae bacterium]|nr:winged helix-turn-helix domain-containing protein [Ktedonobacteraceae bacterium]
MSASFPENPFHRLDFWGRQHELRTIRNRLLSDPPQHCVIIGETYTGKTRLLTQLAAPQGTTVADELKKFTMIYLDCVAYTELTEQADYASALFWWELYSKLQSALHAHESPTIPKPKLSMDQALIEIAFHAKSELEDLLRNHKSPVIILLDNFEGVARLPIRNSQWLRSLGQSYCTYIVASRHLLYLLYQYDPKESQFNLSPLWNMFSDPIYLGLMTEGEVNTFLCWAQEKAEQCRSHWEKDDIDLIRNLAGRHPELLRIACVRLFEQRLTSSRSENDEFLEISIYKDASPICQGLWYGLTDPELQGEPIVDKSYKVIQTLSPHQQVMMAIAKGYDTTEQILLAPERDITRDALFVLEQRGLIERINGKWRVFAEVMRQFILKQERAYRALASVDIDQKILRSLDTEAASVQETHIPNSRSQLPIHIPTVSALTPLDANSEKRQARAFTHLEGKVYGYLKSHAGEVCDKEEIKSAVWENNPPGDSALQKIIERIREKIEDDPENPRYLIAVRGQGYMLREDSIIAS